jgi:hypothetical protein
LYDEQDLRTTTDLLNFGSSTHHKLPIIKSEIQNRKSKILSNFAYYQIDHNMLKGILAISGQPGLFKVLSEGKNGVIVESLLTGTKQTVFASAKMSTLEDIAIYTTHEDFPLKQVFKKISDMENGGAAIQPNSKPEELKTYFEKILPDFDKERVYVSDIKKVLTWYNLLQGKAMLDFEETTPETVHDEEKSILEKEG